MIGRHLVGRGPNVDHLLDRPFWRTSAHHRAVGRGELGAYAINNPDVYYGIPGTTGPATRGQIARVTSITMAGPVGLKFHHRVSATDPVRNIAINDGATGINLPFSLRMPAAGPWPPETSSLTDSNVYAYPRDGGRKDVGDLFHQARFITEYRASLRRTYGLSRNDFNDGSETALGWGSGSSASRMRWPACMLRFLAMRRADPGPLRHCLHVLGTRKNAPAIQQLLAKHWVWPAYGRDSTAGNADENLGDIPYGTRFVIRWIDRNMRNDLGLTTRGLRLFDQLLHYGFYALDGGNEGGQDGGVLVQFRSDHGDGPNGQWPIALRDEILAQLRILVPLCWPVRKVRPLVLTGRDPEIWTNGQAYCSGGGPLYPDQACVAWDA